VTLLALDVPLLVLLPPVPKLPVTPSVTLPAPDPPPLLLAVALVVPVLVLVPVAVLVPVTGLEVVTLLELVRLLLTVPFPPVVDACVLGPSSAVAPESEQPARAAATRQTVWAPNGLRDCFALTSMV